MKMTREVVRSQQPGMAEASMGTVLIGDTEFQNLAFGCCSGLVGCRLDSNRSKLPANPMPAMSSGMKSAAHYTHCSSSAGIIHFKD